MAPRTHRTTRIPSGVASPVTSNYAVKGVVLVNLRDTGDSKSARGVGREGAERRASRLLHVPRGPAIFNSL